MHELLSRGLSVWRFRLGAGCFLAVMVMLSAPLTAVAQPSLREPPIRYHETRGDNPVTRLFARVAAGEVELDYGRTRGYLRSLLQALDVPVSSQALVFSKTSLQSRLISPQNPRAIYFNDDVYVAWVHGSSLLEISTADPKLGAAFYTLRMTPGRPSLRRENDRCLNCHDLPMTQDVPGHLVRSVLTRPSGTINSLTRAYVTDHASPIDQRWGGWYVTGDLGGMQHMGNAFLEDGRLVPRGKPNRADLRDDLDTSPWLSPYSDVVALMVLEHQTQMHNTFTVADFAVRRARHESIGPQAGAADPTNLKAGVDAPQVAESAQPADDATLASVIDQGAERIVDGLLFCGEAPLDDPVSGSSGFAEEFAQRGPVTEDGRSLRQFDLQTRLFRYPCSYLIYSSAFAALDEGLRRRVYQRLGDVLSGRDQAPQYSHLDPPLRRQILGILRETREELPGSPRLAENDSSSAGPEIGDGRDE